MADDIAYEMKRVRGAKRIRLRVRESGTVLITCPWWCPKREALELLDTHRAWIDEQRQRLRERPLALQRCDNDHYRAHKESARRLVRTKVSYWSAFYGFRVQRIAIRNQRSRWGSCSTLGNINIHYKILFLPEHLQDYLIIHELCHLAEPNHSSRFWALVARAYPAYKSAQRELKRT